MVERKRKRLGRVLLLTVLGIIAAVAVFFGITNAVVIGVGGGKIVTAEEAEHFDADCILVLGASVHPDGSPSIILQDRVNRAVELYNAGVAPKIIMSGDNSTAEYNEVRSMKNYAIEQGVPSEDIFCDHAGFSTYESMYRVQSIFGAERVVVVTQTYHQYRALYDANGLGLEAVGVPSDIHTFTQQLWFDIREIPARTKDFFYTLFKVPFAFDGESISLDQSGDITEE